MGIILAIILFSVIVIFHELGHFTLAKINGIQVDEFSLGLGPTLFGKEFHGTKFSLKLLPFGGACMMGEDDTDNTSEGSFNSKSVWARMSVIVAGPVFNFIMALIFSVILVAWVGYDQPVVSQVSPGYSAQEQGIQAGDRIVEMNGKTIHLWREISLYNQMHQGESVDVVYERDGERVEVTLEPKMDEKLGYYLFGISSDGKNTKAGPIKALQYGVYEVKYWIDYTMSSLRMLVTGKVGIKQMSGPVGIVNYVGETYTEASTYGTDVVVKSLMNIAILLSANLGVMNLLPLPALDGGRLAFLIVEAVRRKRIPPEKEGMVHFAGMILLLLLMVVVMYNDISNLL
ncbi:RIP metalloprotease RseP [Hespellia stercorisuis]|uniref:Zinc metalloprotease n=1 Tax=Hespellia stercorisuis DSM 15480 TaxID=1121950 RepID=A0A1M6HU85_9FIRM|nr:RIP metalloprotease RseP [Hespellia stercorisuis]SHJ25802.1 regulator of sigma E protease [Hespellia stercorisuis DSM 15480]